MTKLFKTTSTAILAFSFFLYSTALVFAQEPITIQPVTTFSTPQEAINVIIPAVLGFGALACLAYIMYGGYKYITAGDAPANVSAARQTIINACVGLILLGLSFVIWQFLLGITGIGGTSGTNGDSAQVEQCVASGVPRDQCRSNFD